MAHPFPHRRHPFLRRCSRRVLLPPLAPTDVALPHRGPAHPRFDTAQQEEPRRGGHGRRLEGSEAGDDGLEDVCGRSDVFVHEFGAGERDGVLADDCEGSGLFECECTAVHWCVLSSFALPF